LAVFAALWRLGAAETLAYRASLLVWILTTTFPLISLVLWRALAEAGPIGGWAQADFDRYFVAAFVVRQLTAAWVAWDLDRQIRSGEISLLLLRPISPVLHHVTMNLSTQPLRLALAAPLALVVLLASGGLSQLGLARLGWLEDWRLVPLVPLALVLAWALTFVTQFCVACLAFWLTRAASLYEIYLGGFIVLSGYTVPTALFPERLAVVARALPFHAALGFPVELIVGRLDFAEALAHLGRQLAWLLAFGLLARVLWRRGLRAHGAFGA
jgi:ABC-2 type transport system permease protein